MGCFQSAEVDEREIRKQRSIALKQQEISKQHKRKRRSPSSNSRRYASSTSIDDDDNSNSNGDGGGVSQRHSRSRNNNIQRPSSLQSKMKANRIMATNIPTIDVENDFESIQLLGKGAYASVQLVKHKTSNELFAVKMFNKEALKKDEKYVRDEIDTMVTYNVHQNIVKLHYVNETRTHIYLVLDYVPGSNLLKRALKHGRLSEDECARVVRSIASGLAHLHRYGIVHRDLKLENILCCSKTSLHPVKIADFGLAKAERYFHPITQELTERILKTSCGSPLYVAPEIIGKKSYNSAVDLWALGVIAYSLLSGKNPFYTSGMSNRHLYRRILRGAYDFHDQKWSGISRACRHFICELLVVDPRRRLTAEEVIIHPWITQSNWEKKKIGDLSHTDPLHIRRMQVAASIGSSSSSTDNAPISAKSTTRVKRRGLHRRQGSRVRTYDASTPWAENVAATPSGMSTNGRIDGKQQRRMSNITSPRSTYDASLDVGRRRSHTPGPSYVKRIY